MLKFIISIGFERENSAVRPMLAQLIFTCPEENLGNTFLEKSYKIVIFFQTLSWTKNIQQSCQ